MLEELPADRSGSSLNPEGVASGFSFYGLYLTTGIFSTLVESDGSNLEENELFSKITGRK